MKRFAFPMLSADKLNPFLSGIGAALICHFVKGRVPDTVLLFVFATFITAIYRYFTSRRVEQTLRKQHSHIQGCTRYRLLRLSTRLASIDLFNFPPLPETSNTVLEAVDDAGLIHLAKVQYLCLGMGLVVWCVFFMLRT